MHCGQAYQCDVPWQGAASRLKGRELLLAIKAAMLHTLGHAAQDDEQRSSERLASYQERVRGGLAKRQQGKRKL